MSFPIPDPSKGEESSLVPPGFRFHPTDDELVSYYLTQKVRNGSLVFQAIGEVDFNKCEPWDLPAKANLADQNSFYFFSLKDRKYPTGMRTNRATEAGYWKATGKDREVVSKSARRLLGMKKTLVFYTGRAPKGERTNWIMHEYRLVCESTPHQQEWVVSRVFQKSELLKRSPPELQYNRSDNLEYSADQLSESSFLPALENFESPETHSVNQNSTSNAGQGPLGEQLGYIQPGASFPVQEAILRRSNSSIKVKRESGVQLADSVEHLLFGWDMYTQEAMWDVTLRP